MYCHGLMAVGMPVETGENARTHCICIDHAGFILLWESLPNQTAAERSGATAGRCAVPDRVWAGAKRAAGWPLAWPGHHNHGNGVWSPLEKRGRLTVVAIGCGCGCGCQGVFTTRQAGGSHAHPDAAKGRGEEPSHGRGALLVVTTRDQWRLGQS